MPNLQRERVNSQNLFLLPITAFHFHFSTSFLPDLPSRSNLNLGSDWQGFKDGIEPFSRILLKRSNSSARSNLCEFFYSIATTKVPIDVWMMVSKLSSHQLIDQTQFLSTLALTSPYFHHLVSPLRFSKLSLTKTIHSFRHWSDRESTISDEKFHFFVSNSEIARRIQTLIVSTDSTDFMKIGTTVTRDLNGQPWQILVVIVGFDCFNKFPQLRRF